MSEMLTNPICDFDQGNKGNVVFIWFESTINTSDEIMKTKENVRLINNYTFFPDSINSCVHDMESIGNEKKIFLIISGNDAYKLLSPTVHGLRQLDSIFIFPGEQNEHKYLSDKFNKIVNVFDNSDELLTSIKNNLADAENQMELFSFYNQKQQATQDLSEESAKFLWFQLFNDVICHLPHDDKAKKEMIDTCRRYYRDNQKVLDQIDEFSEEYCKDKCINWYTRDTFLYRLINRALRTEDIDQLYIFRYYIAHLSSQLKDKYQELKLGFEDKIDLYRGVMMAKKEADILKANEGKLIGINGYWSTSRDPSIAFRYIAEHKNNTDQIAVLFKIECNLKDDNDSVIFADIIGDSAFPLEKEVLFDVGAVFKIVKINEEKIENTNVLVVEKKRTGDGREIKEKFLEENRKEMEDESPTIVFCTLLKRIGKVEKSLDFLEKLLENPGDENLAHIHNRIGIALRTQNEHKRAVEYFEKAYELAINSNVPQRKYAALILYNKGRVYDKTKQFEEALCVSEEAVKILEELNDKSDNIAKLYSSIGRIYYHQEKFDEALKYQRKALKIREEYLSPEHVVIACSYADIGNIYLRQENFDDALKYHNEALKLRKEYLPSDHHNIAWSLHRVGIVYKKKRDSKLALEYHLASLEIREEYNSTSLNNLILDTLKGIISIYGDKSNETLTYRLKALKIRRKIQSTGDSILADDLEKIASVYKSIKNWNESLKYYKEAVQIRRRSEPIKYSILLIDLKQIIEIYGLMHNTEDMLMYYKEAIQIHKKVESISYSTLADDLDTIARKYKLMNDLNESLNYYKAAVETRENHLPNDYSNLAGSLYGLASIYEKMGEYTNALEYYNRQMNIYTENLNYDPTHILHRKAEENIDRMRQLI